MKNYVAYYRVSTQKQGQSGLGLEAQRSAARHFVHHRGLITREFTEVESGKKNHRTMLAAAIAEANASGATLLIAKLDRLSRNAGFIFQLRDSGVDFVCCDMPDANTLTVGIFAVIAQHERETISARTRAALGAKKARGEAMGTPANLTPEAIRRGREVRSLNARTNQANLQASQLIKLLLAQSQTLRQVAQTLNTYGYRTRRGKAFTAMQVARLARFPPPPDRPSPV
ncbi:recombinase family protein [Hymenobacter terrenus]|uniref:recombinase family protein n=1 Tax=Hymenobacter terrenus TaxID=1629124 RepID=UPI0006196224|nr:recombinase family protein [Hymenobacter terrenus]